MAKGFCYTEPMTLAADLFVFILGTIVGSFLNVVALRYNSGLSLGGRSCCFSCSKTLRWYELIPLASFLFLRGRCGRCRSGVSLQYPLVELLTGLIFLLIWNHESILWNQESFTVYCLLSTVYFFVVFSILIVIAIYDNRHKIIPDGLVFSFVILALGRLFFTVSFLELVHFPGLWNLLAGPILFLPFFLLWFISGGQWMGLGDAKLALGVGWLLPLAHGLTALIFAFWTGALVSLFLLVIQRLRVRAGGKAGLSLDGKHLTMKSEIPFAPFLIFGTLIAFLSGVDIFWLGGLLGTAFSF